MSSKKKDKKKSHDASRKGRKKSAMCNRCDMMQLRFNRLNLSEEDRAKKSVIHVSAHIAHTDCVLASIASGTDMDLSDAHDMTPLIIAAQNGNTDTVVALVEAGADIHIDDINGHTPLYFCVVGADVKAVKCILEAAAASGDPGAWYASDMRVVMREALAISRDDPGSEDIVECVELLGKHNARVSELFDETHMDAEADWGCRDWYDVFDSFPDRVMEQIVQLYLCERDYVLHEMVCGVLRIKKCPVLKMLLDRNVHVGEKEKNKRLLDASNISWLLVNLHFPDKLENLRIVLDHPSDVIRQNMDIKRYGMTPLQWACHDCQSFEVVKEFLSHGADPDIGDEHRGTPIFVALTKMSKLKDAVDIFVLLLRYNCSLSTWRYIIDGPNSVAEIQIVDLAIIAENLYAAKMLVLAGAQNWNWKTLAEADDARPPHHMRASRPEMLLFMGQNLCMPRSLYIQCRRKIRQLLGVDADEKISSLQVAQDVKSFLRFRDIEEIAKKYKEDLGEDLPDY